tara:strand:- start:237 stop:479 length:243 start_codon:yes stop_codon:yes gene_type:complete
LQKQKSTVVEDHHEMPEPKDPPLQRARSNWEKPAEKKPREKVPTPIKEAEPDQIVENQYPRKVEQRSQEKFYDRDLARGG